PVELQAGDFHELSFPDASFDLILSAFTLRSVQDMPRFLGGIFRVLKPGGRVAFLELTRPRNFLLKLFFIPYVKIYLPLVGRWVSGNDTAYRFLSESVRHFQSPSVVMERMEKAGFSELSTKSFSFGTATLIIGRK
ncbi:MAG TPA: class I SAM-dependent methyltransferase, partial [Candidatus Omnitrophota bacterium]|nr:class I SAM-dependent methyltransferase [Candidatus Omnitrophota bacterium]